MPRTLRGFKISVALILVLLPFGAQPAPFAAAQGLAWPSSWLASSAFYNVWARTDEPVAAGAAARSWLWSPVPFAVANEAYTESVSKTRLVEYFDKGRMEINDPAIDHSSPWFVTSGLLVNEMVTGQVQIGNGTFEARGAASVPVAGDAESSTPTYASFAAVTGPSLDLTGQIASGQIGKDGSVTSLANASSLDTHLFSYASYDAVSRHNIPWVFKEWTAQTARVLSGGRLVQGPLLDTLYVLGRPITDAYWVRVPVNGMTISVLVQLFERRALTYNPANPEAWRVEMANVGRAYYNWRYGAERLGPAISGEIGRGGITIKGWNWQPASQATVEVDMADGSALLSGPTTVTATGDGTFTAVISSTTELGNALVYGSAVVAKAKQGGRAAQLPIGGASESGSVQIHGVITRVSGADTTQFEAAFTDRSGKDWLLHLAPGAAIRYSEGDSASASAITPGAAVRVDGTAASGTVTASTLRLASVSRTGAQLGYKVLGSGNAQLAVSGTDWPAGRSVVFTASLLNAGGAPPLGQIKADSRGNLTGVLPLPAGTALPQGPLWLIAQSSDTSRLLAQVAKPLDLPPTGQTGDAPPLLYIEAKSGEALGGLGSYCWRAQCADAVGVPLPLTSLTVAQGELLGLRSQYGAQLNAGLTPVSLHADLFSYNTPEGQVAQIENTAYFTPQANPIFTTGNLPGKPFSVTLPKGLASGLYVLVAGVSWLDPAGGTGGGTYGFLLSVP
jgi:hypothetical protein